MALSDCPECWETPCICGHEYKDWAPDRKQKLAHVLVGDSCASCETLRQMYKQKLSELFHMENKMKRMQVLIDAAETMADTLAYAPALGRLWINKKEWDDFEEVSKAYREFLRAEKKE